MSRTSTALLVACLMLIVFAPEARARNTELHLPIKDVLEDPETKAKLGSDIALFFGKQAMPGTYTDLGEFVTNRKTNGFAKDDEKACRWVMLSVLVQLATRAKELGGDAVIEIRSYYGKKEFVSDTEYECHAGGVMAGVALKGRIVKRAR